VQPVDDSFHIVKYWQSWKLSKRVPKTASIALPVVMMPVASVDVERSFSKTGQILSPRCHNLNDENFRGLAALYFNGNIQDTL